jgi:hypothetical protein
MVNGGFIVGERREVARNVPEMEPKVIDAVAVD